MEFEWAENRLDEFNLWTATTGAFAGEKASLDARLAVEWETKNLVTSILILLLGNDLVESIGGRDDSDDEFVEALEFQDQDQEPIPRAFSPWSDQSSSVSSLDSASDAEPEEDDQQQQLPSPLQEAKAEVEQIIDHLTRLAIAIRKSGSNSRAHKADKLFKPERHQRLRDHLNLIVLTRGTKEGRDDYGIAVDSLTNVQERLIMANLRRRNRYLYAQRHARKLALEASNPGERSLPWAKDEDPGIDEDNGNGGDDDGYFDDDNYFDQGSEDHSQQDNVFTDSERDSEGLASLPSNASTDPARVSPPDAQSAAESEPWSEAPSLDEAPTELTPPYAEFGGTLSDPGPILPEPVTPGMVPEYASYWVPVRNDVELDEGVVEMFKELLDSRTASIDNADPHDQAGGPENPKSTRKRLKNFWNRMRPGGKSPELFSEPSRPATPANVDGYASLHLHPQAAASIPERRSEPNRYQVDEYLAGGDEDDLSEEQHDLESHTPEKGLGPGPRMPTPTPPAPHPDRPSSLGWDNEDDWGPVIQETARFREPPPVQDSYDAEAFDEVAEILQPLNWGQITSRMPETQSDRDVPDRVLLKRQMRFDDTRRNLDRDY
ncbi:hypothetical protein ACO1O0_008426 [Amphichorda felina]